MLNYVLGILQILFVATPQSQPDGEARLALRRV